MPVVEVEITHDAPYADGTSFADRYDVAVIREQK